MKFFVVVIVDVVHIGIVIVIVNAVVIVDPRNLPLKFGQTWSVIAEMIRCC